MSGDITTIARPYAEAVFARARDTGQLDPWSGALSLLATIAGSPAMMPQVANPNVPRERLRDIILEIAGVDLPPEARNLVRLLSENNRLGALGEIARLFEDLRAAQAGVRQIIVRSAYPLKPAEQNQIAAALKARFGEDVQLTVEKNLGSSVASRSELATWSSTARCVASCSSWPTTCKFNGNPTCN